MWVRFTADYDFRPSARRGVTIAYKAGMVENVTRECGERAIKAKRAERASAPGKGSDNGKVSRDASDPSGDVSEATGGV